MGEMSEAMRKLRDVSAIPYYAYGDNEAACMAFEAIASAIHEIDRLTTESSDLVEEYNEEQDAHRDTKMQHEAALERIKELLAECSDYKRAAIDAESRLIDLTEELLRRGKANGAIGWPQIRRMVERASVSGRRECEHDEPHRDVADQRLPPPLEDLPIDDSDRAWADSKHKIICHAEGDTCHGCDHYHGKADVCVYAAEQGQDQ